MVKSRFLLQPVIPEVRRSGDIAVDIYSRDFQVQHKRDNSPVTEADMAVDDLIVAALEEHFPHIPVVTEERIETQRIAEPAERYFLVDPIDGTREFVSKSGEFTINVGLIENGSPVAGIVYAPALKRLFVGEVGGLVGEVTDEGKIRPIGVRKCGDDGIIAVASRTHDTPRTQQFLDQYKIKNCVRAGSSLKFCLLAAGEADIYPRFGPTMEWDTAAGHAILRAAGGLVLNTDRSPLEYGKPGFKNPDFIACSPQANHRCPAPL